jgi:hypothetical protein
MFLSLVYLLMGFSGGGLLFVAAVAVICTDSMLIDGDYVCCSP